MLDAHKIPRGANPDLVRLDPTPKQTEPIKISEKNHKYLFHFIQSFIFLPKISIINFERS